MKFYQKAKDAVKKYALPFVGGVILSVTSYLVGNKIGSNKGFDEGYKIGRQNTVEKMKKVADVEIDNYEHNIKIYNESMWCSTPEQIMGLEGLSQQERDKRNAIKNLVQIAENENISINGSAF